MAESISMEKANGYSEDFSEFSIDCGGIVATDQVSFSSSSFIEYAQILYEENATQFFANGLYIDIGGSDDILAYKILYDACKNRMSALQQQAARADAKQCKTYPVNGNRPGWRVVEYHRRVDEYIIHPASYLGPGLWPDTSSALITLQVKVLQIDE